MDSKGKGQNGERRPFPRTIPKPGPSNTKLAIGSEPSQGNAKIEPGRDFYTIARNQTTQAIRQESFRHYLSAIPPNGVWPALESISNGITTRDQTVLTAGPICQN